MKAIFLTYFMDKWQERKRPIRLEKRFEFESYQHTRDFLDLLGSKCEALDRFPDISFGTTYVNITLRPDNLDKDAIISPEDRAFAKEIDTLF